MKRSLFDVLVIATLTIALLLLNRLEAFESVAKFMFIPLLGCYYLGQFAVAKFRK